MKTQLELGVEGIEATCMQEYCNLKITHSAWELLRDAMMSDGKTSAYDKYLNWSFKKFTEENNKVKWCPKLGCGLVSLIRDNADPPNPLECSCGTQFCKKCEQPYHDPVSCSDAKKWEKKNSNEGENA
jgi:ariadne-1